MFMDPRKYDFSRVGRLKFNIKMGRPERERLDDPLISPSDFFDVIDYVLKLKRVLGEQNGEEVISAIAKLGVADYMSETEPASAESLAAATAAHAPSLYRVMRMLSGIGVFQEHSGQRFTLTPPGVLMYRFTVDDPTAWTAPWTGEIPLVPIDGMLYEYACHEGNRGMENILRAARQDIKKAGGK